MVGLLNAPPGTRLHQRLKKEKRLLQNFSGDQMDCSLNFIPKMNHETLIKGYKNILDTIYSPSQYYERIKTFLKEYRPAKRKQAPSQLRFFHIRALIKSMWVLGVRESGRKHYWKLFVSTLLKRPRAFPLSISLTIYGYHFRKVAEKYINTPIGNIL